MIYDLHLFESLYSMKYLDYLFDFDYSFCPSTFSLLESLSAALPPFDSLLEEISSLSPAEQVYYVDQYCLLARQFRVPVPEEAQRYLRDRSGSSRSSPVHNEIHPYLSSVKAEESVESKGESQTVEYIHDSSDHQVAISLSTGLVECPVSEMERQSKFETQMERLHEEARQYLKESYQTEIDHLRSELAAVRKEKEVSLSLSSPVLLVSNWDTDPTLSISLLLDTLFGNLHIFFFSFFLFKTEVSLSHSIYSDDSLMIL